MGKKLYEKTEEGGIRFSSGRKPGEVRVPNYVYDLWLPLLGATAVGVYNLYCRLEREKIVKAISLKNIANACRIGTGKLDKINEALKKCGFIEIAKPTGWKRLAHYTTEFKVLDPPHEVPAQAIEEYAADRGYESLTPWLVAEEAKTPIGSSETPNGFSGESGQVPDKDPGGTPKVATLGLQPLDVEILDIEHVFPEKIPIVERIIAQTQTHPDQFDLGRRTETARAASGNYAVPAQAGGGDAFCDGPVDAFCEVLAGIAPALLPPKKRKQWAQKLRQIAEEWSTEGAVITAQIVERAIRAVPDDCDIGWKTYKSPFVGKFDEEIGPLLLNGGNPRQKGAPHGSHQRDNRSIAPGAVPRRVASAEEARAILGDKYRGK